MHNNKQIPVKLYYVQKNTQTSIPGDEFIDPVLESNIQKHIRTNTDYVADEIHDTNYGKVLYAFALIRDNRQAVRGITVVEVYTRELEAFNKSIQSVSSIIFVITMLVTFLLTLILARSIIHPIRILSSGVNNLAQGDLTTHVLLPRKDEFGNLAETFNDMVDKIRNITEETIKLNRELSQIVNAYNRFVPHKFLNFLGRDRIVEIHMAIMLNAK